MIWIILGLLIVVPGLAWLIFGWQPFGRNLGREEFAGLLYSLLIIKEDGGSLHLKHRESDVTLDFFRGQGATTNGANILLVIPRAPWSVKCKDKLFRTLVSNQYEVKLIDDPDAPVLAGIKIVVEDIWVKWSGATAARAAHLVLDTVGIPREAKFNLTLRGNASTRYFVRDRQLHPR